VVLFEINQPGIARTELECDTPRPVDMNGVSCWFETLQIVEIETWQLQFLKPFSRIQPVKPGKNWHCGQLQRRIDLPVA
jgi:hypothetical protein